MVFPKFFIEYLFKLFDSIVRWYGRKNEWIVLDTRGKVIGRYRDKKKDSEL